jgi:hypothetical protein
MQDFYFEICISNTFIPIQNFIDLMKLFRKEIITSHKIIVKEKNNFKTVKKIIFNYAELNGNYLKFVNNKYSYVFINGLLTILIKNLGNDYSYYFYNNLEENYCKNIFYKSKDTYIDNDEEINGVYGKIYFKIYKTHWGYRNNNDKEVIFCKRTYEHKNKKFTNFYYLNNFKIIQTLDENRKEINSTIEKLTLTERFKYGLNNKLDLTTIIDLVKTPFPFIFNSYYCLFRKFHSYKNTKLFESNLMFLIKSY